MAVKRSIQLMSVILAIVLLLTIAPTFAQQASPTPTPKNELVGVIQAINGNTITVNGQIITITGAEIKLKLEVGAIVKIHIQVSTSGNLTATEIELAKLNPEATASPEGTLEPEDTPEAESTRDAETTPDGESTPEATGTPEACIAKHPDGWKTYTIQAGDTMSGIAVRADSDMKDIMHANCITNPRGVIVGTVIFVPKTLIASTPTGDDKGKDNSGHDKGDDKGKDNSGHDKGDDKGNNGGSDKGDDKGDDKGKG
jgi:LysM repeat protein